MERPCLTDFALAQIRHVRGFHGVFCPGSVRLLLRPPPANHLTHHPPRIHRPLGFFGIGINRAPWSNPGAGPRMLPRDRPPVSPFQTHIPPLPPVGVDALTLHPKRKAGQASRSGRERLQPSRATHAATRGAGRGRLQRHKISGAEPAAAVAPPQTTSPAPTAWRWPSRCLVMS